MKRVWIVGAGKRVRETALPALASLAGEFEVGAVLARSERELQAAGRAWPVRTLKSLSGSELGDDDVLYVAVGKDAVPFVLIDLMRFDRGRLELLIDTPVLRFKHLRHTPLLAPWKRAGVAEDVAFLPWYETVRAAAGPVERVVFDRSAYAYHGCAAAKALVGAERIASARRKKIAGGAERTYAFDGGRRAIVLEPRDYAQGRVVVHGARASVSDRWEPGDGPREEREERDGTTSPARARLDLLPIVDRGLCVGFRAGPHETRLDPREAELTRGDPDRASVTARMESMKRIGFRRLLQSIAAGRGAYPVEQGLDDMAVDWFLERFRSYRANALTDVREPFARWFWGLFGRLR
ncbi:MAG: hypothetical protein IPJ77_00985 [Planctomycetes bacterium]|nr:hypothetical protein [Planctomycetota bacterium]